MADEAGSSRIKQYEALVEQVNKTTAPLNESCVEQIEQLITDVESQTDDIVFQVNCLQLIADLACSKQALAILEDKRVPEKLINLLSHSDTLIVPHALKLFYRVEPIELETKYPQVLDLICEYCQSENTQFLDYAVDFIGAIGRSGYQARKVLDNHDQFKKKCLSSFGRTLISSDPLLKSRTLRCVADLLEIHEEDPQAESVKLSEKFYHAILEGENKCTTQLLALCRIPIMEVRVSAMNVIASVADQDWAQKELATHPTFLKWILDRSSEACKEGKESKFEILRALVKSKTTSRVFKGEDYLKMRADYKNGPFHVGIAEEMLMDDKPGDS